MDLEKSDGSDPKPDILALFFYYNDLYFNDSLGHCIVSSAPMTSCAGTCHYLLGGNCEIRLSERLLKSRSTNALKNTLLHEMIHAFLWFKTKNKDHSNHGPSFLALMNEINSSSHTDHQKPYGGYNITIHHEFQDEADSYSIHHWMCESCGDVIKRSMNGEPSARDCIEKVGHAGSCANPSCHWHRHKMICSGSYMKIEEPPAYKSKRRGSKGEHELHEEKSKGSPHITRMTTRRSRQEDDMKDKLDAKESNRITNFFPSSGDANRNSRKNSLFGDKSQREFNRDELKAIGHEMVPEIPKRARSPVPRKKRKYTCIESSEFGKCKNECTVIIEWLDVYADEEDDEDIEPLVNKRTERRKKQKLLKSLMGRTPEVVAIDDGSPSHTST